MKKILVILCVLWSGGHALAQDLTVGDTLVIYFNELFPIVYLSHSEVTLKYTDLGNKPGLRSALQRGVYYELIKNSNKSIGQDSLMKDRTFAALLKKHFGVEIATDNSYLTRDDYENFMKLIRQSFAYNLLQKINSTPNNTHEKTLTDIPTVSQIESTQKYYILNEVFSILKNNHLDADKFSDDMLIYSAAEGLAKGSGDTYTQYLPPETSHVFQQNLEGKIAGIGVLIEPDIKNGLIVKEVIEKSPAEKSGLKSQDQIIKINGVLVDTSDGIEDEILRLRGKEKTSVLITVLSNHETKNVTVIRAIISVPLIEAHNLSTSHIITYKEVAFGTDKTLKNFLEKFIATGKKRLILDLRDNPGGSMLETRNILNFFIDKGNPLVMLKYQKKQNTYTSTLDRIVDWSQYEIIILVNKNTASAAEIIAAVLREYFPTNLIIIGDKTYGKGVVQELISFDDHSILKYTVAEWFTGKNNISINKKGIQPDMSVPFDQEVWKKNKLDTQLTAAEKYVFPKK